MKRTKCILSLLLALMLCTTCVMPGFAANTPKLTVIEEAPISLTNAIEQPEGYQTNVDWDAVTAAIMQGIKNREETILLNTFGIEYNEANVAYIADILYNTPYVLGVVYGFSSSVVDYGNPSQPNLYNGIVPQYRADCNKTEYNLRLRNSQVAVIQLTEGIKGNTSLTDAEKSLLLHDRLVAWCEYDTTAGTGDSAWVSHSAYAALVLRKAVCQGYVLAYMQLLEECGIESYYIMSDALGHSWVKVMINGQAYFTDATWDDPTWDVRGQVCHDNILLSYDAFQTNHNKNGVTDYDTTPADTTYDNAGWKGIKSEIIYIDGLFYYINADKTAIEAVADFNGATPQKAVDLSAYNSWYFTQTQSWKGNYSRLAAVGKVLYYSTDSAVYSYNTVTGEKAVFWNVQSASLGESYRIYGMNIIEGTMNIVLNTTPNIASPAYYNNTVSVPVCQHPVIRCILAETPALNCQNGAYAKVMCRDCRKAYDANYPAGHQWNDAVTVSHGTGSHTCYNCGATETFDWDEAHTWVLSKVIAPTCKKQGYEIYKCTETDCTATKKMNYTDFADHTWVVSETVAPDCTTNGYTLSVCSVCGATKNSGVLEKLGHDWVKGETFAPTCKVKGYTVYTCSRCPETKQDNFTDTIKHSWKFVETIAPTCTKDGYDLYQCSVCGDYGKKNEVPSKHDWEFVETIAPTCAHKGYDLYECTICHQKGEKNEVPSLEHDWINANERREATCTDGAYDLYVCTVCGKEGKKNETEALGHIDENKDGKCDRCGAEVPVEKTFFQKILDFFNKIMDYINNFIDNNEAPDFIKNLDLGNLDLGSLF